MKLNKKSNIISMAIAALVVLLFVVIFVLSVVHKNSKAFALEQETIARETDDSSENRSDVPTTAKEAQINVLNYQVFDFEDDLIQFNEGIYRRRSRLKNLLFIGLDDDSSKVNFLMILSSDEANGQITVVEINPAIQVQGTTDYSDNLEMTIAESATLGIDNLIQQCENLFYGSVFDYYIAMKVSDTSQLLENLEIAIGTETEQTNGENQAAFGLEYGEQFINSFLQYIQESKLNEDLLEDIWSFINEHSQNNTKIKEMGQFFVDIKTFDIRNSWDTPALWFLAGFNLIRPEYKNNVINLFFEGVQY